MLRRGKLVVLPGEEGEALRWAGIQTFDDLWDLPHSFVDDVNRRRGGWSGTVPFQLPGHDTVYYVKRQENQMRYSLAHPFGRLTYQYEVEAILKCGPNKALMPPLAAYGFRANGNVRQAIVVTAGIGAGYRCLASEREQSRIPLESLRKAGQCLYAYHSSGWRHGALFPEHIFIEPAMGRVRLIDFERSRRCLLNSRAASRDLSQLLKRTRWMPRPSLQAFLEAYETGMPRVLRHLGVNLV